MQSNTYKKKSYAKINFYLDVIDKMENGYHNIESVMQSISLFDEVSLTVSEAAGENEITITSNSSQIPLNEKNLVYKAAVKFLAYLENIGKKITKKKLSFHIEKNIPVEAGMAGGSTNCASALYLLNEAFNYPLEDNELLSLGASLGADVAFCQTGGTALCRGIGEKITKLKSAPTLNLVSAIGNSGISTPIAFGLLDEKFGTNPGPSARVDDFIFALESGNLEKISASLYNKFEAVIEPINESVAEIKNALLKCGALGALMSGSGPSVFGIFASEIDAKNAYNELKKKDFRVFLCKTV